MSISYLAYGGLMAFPSQESERDRACLYSSVSIGMLGGLASNIVEWSTLVWSIRNKPISLTSMRMISVGFYSSNKQSLPWYGSDIH